MASSGWIPSVILDNFTGAETEFGSLRDGGFTLTAIGSQISADGLAMASNYTFGDADGLLRLFGDAEGDRDVDLSDFNAFHSAYGNGTSIFDLEGDGDTDVSDFVAFRNRYGTTLP